MNGMLNKIMHTFELNHSTICFYAKFVIYKRKRHCIHDAMSDNSFVYILLVVNLRWCVVRLAL